MRIDLPSLTGAMYVISVLIVLPVCGETNAATALQQVQSAQESTAPETGTAEVPAPADDQLPRSEAQSNAGSADSGSLEQRVDVLEQRVEQLESILFATAQLNVNQAERRVVEMRELVRETERLHARGFTTTVQLQNDRFLLEQAVLELRLAHAGNNNRFIACQLAVAGAENNLRLAVERLRLSEEQAVRGFIPPEHVQRDRYDVQLLEMELEVARKRLESIEILNSIEPATGTSPARQPVEQSEEGGD
ncbi:MAG: hypothetical protein AAF456_21475 [Planctomycetota bacterium]